MRRTRRLSPKKLCRHLRIIYDCGLCARLNCLCPGYECDFRDTCGLCFEECRHQVITPIPKAYEYYDEALNRLNNAISSEMRNIPETQLLGGLLWLREDNVLSALTSAPGDITSSCLLNSFLGDISWLSETDIKSDERILRLANLFYYRIIFESTSNMLRNDDLMILHTHAGSERLETLRSNPLKFIRETNDEMMKAVGRQAALPYPHMEMRQCYSAKMLPAYVWSKRNSYPVSFQLLTQYQEFDAIMKHMENTGKTHRIDRRTCYNLSYPVFMNLLYLGRYMYSHVEQIKRTIDLLIHRLRNHLPQIDDSLDVQSWDGTVSSCYLRLKNNNFFTRVGPKTGKLPWPVQLSDCFTYGSLLMIGVMLKNRKEIMLKPYEKGPLFEKRLYDELVSRDVRIIQRNFSTPRGEVDFLCEKNSKYYVIEAKEYGPWYGYWYMDSQLFSERTQRMRDKIALAESRRLWLEANKTRFGIPKLSPLKGLIITRFTEDFLEIPLGVRYLALPQIDSVFGKSRY